MLIVSYVSCISLVPDYEAETVENLSVVFCFPSVDTNDGLIGSYLLFNPFGVLFALVNTHDVLTILIDELDSVDVCSIADSESNFSDSPPRVYFSSCLVQCVWVLAIIHVHRCLHTICEI